MTLPSDDAPAICVLSLWPIVTVTIETRDEQSDDIYFNAGGQGFWIARMAQSLGARTTFCGPFGGHTGALAQALVRAEGLSLRAVSVSGANGSYIDDRRSGKRGQIASQAAPSLSRHEADDLYDAALAEGLKAGTLVISGQIGERILPAERMVSLARYLSRNGVHVIADVAGPVLNALSGGVSILKVSHEELIDAKLAQDDSREEIVAAMRRLADGAAECVVASMADRGALGLFDGVLYEVRQPAFEAIDTSGAGDSMTAGLAVSRALGRTAEETLRMAAAAGALNVTRRGRGTGSECDIEEVSKLVEVQHFEIPDHA